MKPIKFTVPKGEFRPTNDDWYPNYEGNLVRLRVLSLSDGMWRVCVWGNDDTGMEIDAGPCWNYYMILESEDKEKVTKIANCICNYIRKFKGVSILY